jgi:hypothetical protein
VTDNRPQQPIGARVGAILLAVAFSLLMPVALMAHSITAVVFSPETMAAVLTRQFSLAEAVRRPVFDALLGSESGPAESLDLRRALEHMTPEQQQDVLDTLIPARWAQEQLESAVGQAYAWLDSEAPYPTLILDLRPVKVHLLDSAVQAAVVRVMDSWPECTGEMLTGFAASLLAGDARMVYCAPPGALGEMVAGFLTSGLTAGVQTLPAQLVLTPGSERTDEMLELKQDLVTWRSVGRWGWLIPLGMLFLILALVVRSLSAWGRWWGWPLLGAGALSLLGLLGGGWLWGSGLRRLAGQTGAAIVLDVFDGVLAGIADAILTRLLAAAGLVLLSGIGLLAMASVVTRRRPAEAAAAIAAESGPGSGAEPPPTGMFG